MLLGISSPGRARSRLVDLTRSLRFPRHVSSHQPSSAPLLPYSTRPKSSIASDHSQDSRIPMLLRAPRPSTRLPDNGDNKYTRNLMSRDAFWDARAAAPDDPRMKAALASPFVPAALEYPSSVATKRSRQKAQKAARVIMALDTIWAEHLHSRHFLTSRLGWETIFSDLKAMTPRGSEDRKISALRVRLPETWDLDLKNKTINFVESSTGVVAKLRTSPYYKGSSVIVLRGWSETLADRKSVG